jgi:hypothetical protein
MNLIRMPKVVDVLEFCSPLPFYPLRAPITTLMITIDYVMDVTVTASCSFSLMH